MYIFYDIDLQPRVPVNFLWNKIIEGDKNLWFHNIKNIFHEFLCFFFIVFAKGIYLPRIGSEINLQGVTAKSSQYAIRRIFAVTWNKISNMAPLISYTLLKSVNTDWFRVNFGFLWMIFFVKMLLSVNYPWIVDGIFNSKKQWLICINLLISLSSID